MGSSSSDKRQPIKRRSIFVSSTHRDLIAHRQQVSDTLLRLGLFPVAMEQFGAQGGGDATSVSTEKVAEAEVYLGIFAWCYGYIPPGENRSVTHLEFLEARRLGRPCYLFLAQHDTEADEILFPLIHRDPEHLAQLMAFREELQQSVVDYFTTPDDLARKIAAPLSDYLIKQERENPLKGLRPPRELPPRAVGFVGRDTELEMLCGIFRQFQDQAVAAAIVGMGGVGKSSLAAEVVHTLASEEGSFLGGLTWVRCDERTDLPGLVWIYDQILAAWNITPTAEELGRTTTPEVEVAARERLLRDQLRNASNTGVFAPALVLLDNIEYGLPISHLLETLGTLNIAVLVTSRTDPFLPHLRLVSLEALEPAAAVRLFARRYVDRGGAWDEIRDGPAAASIAEALGNLPLALELVASRATLKRIHVATMAQELNEPAVLTRLKGPRDRSISVRYSLGKSLDLLTPVQRRRFAALGLPDGPDWPRPFVEQLFDTMPLPPGQAELAEDDLDLLATLSLISLIAPDDPADSFHRLSLPLFSPLLAGSAPDASSIAAPKTTAPATTRVRLHPLLRELAREEWVTQSAETQRAGLQALVAGVRMLAEEYQSNFAALSREVDMLAGALRGAAREHVALQHLSAAIDALFEYLSVSGHWRMGLELLTLQRNARRDLGDRAGEGATLNHLGILSVDLGRTEPAVWIFEQALAIGREVHDRKCEGEALHWLGLIAYFQGHIEQAKSSLERALELVREVHDHKTEGEVLNDLGLVAQIRGNHSEAEQYFQKALSIEHDAQNWRGEGITLTNLGNVAQSLGRKAEAVEYYKQALLLQRKIGAKLGEAATLNFVGQLAQELGRKEEAFDYYQQALTIQQDIGDQRGKSGTLVLLGILNWVLGHHEQVEAYYQEALTLQRKIGDRTSAGATLSYLSLFTQAQGRSKDSARFAEEALSIHREAGNRGMEAITLLGQARLAANEGRQEEALSKYEQIRAQFHELDYRAYERMVLRELAELHSAAGHTEEAKHYNEQALAIEQEPDERTKVLDALNTLGRLEYRRHQ
jgi:tetratricopeptide (TPR) repeat protein